MTRQEGKPAVSLIFPEQYQQAAEALGRAFINDPPMWAVLPDLSDPAERARRIAMLFSVVLEIQRRNGQPVFGVVENEKVAAAAVVEGVGQTPPGALSVLGLVPRMVAAVGTRGALRAARLSGDQFRNRPPKPHLYLSLLGVNPPYQQRHFGIALLDHLRDLASLRGELAGVYLETATEANVAYYTRAGYETIGEMFSIGVRMWRMMQPRR
ncbi:MAG TPA: GNAT family N-acetyltransferase [Candidatus Binataceae bacterium]|nr:GNAT family N-acetyltransferase [Candidatus Binataceae bacterium]